LSPASRVRYIRAHTPAGGARVMFKAMIAALGACLVSFTGQAARAEVRVAAASDLQFVLPELAESFRRSTGVQVSLVFGASGNLSRQIRQGADFDLFLSADESYVARLRMEGRTQGAGSIYAVGRLILATRADTGALAGGGLEGLRQAIARGTIRRFAIANPEHAPYGARAREALEKAGLWAGLKDRLVLGESAAQAGQYVLSGAADAGLIAHSLSFSPNLGGRLRYWLIPETLHSPLRQEMTLLSGAEADARRFFDFLGTAEARSAFRRHGFEAPPAERKV